MASSASSSSSSTVNSESLSFVSPAIMTPGTKDDANDQEKALREPLLLSSPVSSSQVILPSSIFSTSESSIDYVQLYHTYNIFRFYNRASLPSRLLYDQRKYCAWLPGICIILMSGILITTGLFLLIPVPPNFPSLRDYLRLTIDDGQYVGYGCVAGSILLPLLSLACCIFIAVPNKSQRQKSEMYVDALFEELLNGTNIKEHIDTVDPTVLVNHINTQYYHTIHHQQELQLQQHQQHSVPNQHSYSNHSSSGSNTSLVSSLLSSMVSTARKSPSSRTLLTTTESVSSKDMMHSEEEDHHPQQGLPRDNDNNNDDMKVPLLFSSPSSPSIPSLPYSFSSSSSSSSSPLPSSILSSSSPLPHGIVLMLPGIGSPRIHNLSFAYYLALQGFRVTTIDLPEHGSLSSVTFSLNRCERIISTVIDRELTNLRQQFTTIKNTTGNTTKSGTSSTEANANPSSSSSSSSTSSSSSPSTHHPYTSAFKCVTLIAYGASAHVAAFYALRHPNQIGGLAFIGKIPDYTTTSFEYLLNRRIYFLRWVCSIANLSIKGRIQASRTAIDIEKNELLNHDWNYAVLPQYIREIRQAQIGLGTTSISNIKNSVATSLPRTSSGGSTIPKSSSSSSSTVMKSSLRNPSTDTRHRNKTLLSSLHTLYRPMLIISKENQSTMIRTLLNNPPLATYTYSKGINHDSVHTLNPVKLEKISTNLALFCHKVFTFMDTEIPIEEEAIALASAARSSFLGNLSHTTATNTSSVPPSGYHRSPSIHRQHRYSSSLTVNSHSPLQHHHPSSSGLSVSSSTRRTYSGNSLSHPTFPSPPPPRYYGSISGGSGSSPGSTTTTTTTTTTNTMNTTTVLLSVNQPLPSSLPPHRSSFRKNSSNAPSRTGSILSTGGGSSSHRGSLSVAFAPITTTVSLPE